MEQDKTREKRARIIKAEELYRSGLSLEKVGRLLTPPVSGQRVAQLLRAGAEMGLFEIPTRRAVSHEVDEAAVRKALDRGRTHRRAAQMLGIPLSDLTARFASVLNAVARERRTERSKRTRDGIIDEYGALARRLGHNPTSAELRNTSLNRRICRYFGTFEDFWNQAGVRPDYTKKSWRERERRRQSTD